MGERWTREQFKAYWNNGDMMDRVAVPCDCGEDTCHGWQALKPEWLEDYVMLDQIDREVANEALKDALADKLKKQVRNIHES